MDLKINSNTKFKGIILTVDKYPERLTKLKDFIETLFNIGIEVEIFKGVNGEEIINEKLKENLYSLSYKDEKYLYDRTKRINGQVMKKGELGCALSHLNIYKKLLEDINYDSYLIFEDDVEFSLSIDQIVNILNNVPETYDVLHLSKSDWYPFIKNYKINDYFYSPFKNYFNRLTGYMVSKKGADNLLKYANGYINIPADDLLSNMYIKNNLELYVPNNFLFVHREGEISIINTVNNI